MLNNLLGSDTLPLLEQLARFSERRQALIAGNLANVDTPGYRTRDLPVSEFREALAAAAHRDNGPDQRGSLWPSGVLRRGEKGSSLAELFPERLFEAVTDDDSNITFHDAGNRSIEREMTEMSKNLLQQEFALRVMRMDFDKLSMVISERVI